MGIIGIIDSATKIVSEILTPIAFGLCTLYFFWGVAKYIKVQSESEKAEGKKAIVWGLVGIFVAFSVWGIVFFLQSELALPIIDTVERP